MTGSQRRFDDPQWSATQTALTDHTQYAVVNHQTEEVYDTYETRDEAEHWVAEWGDRYDEDLDVEEVKANE